MKKKYTLIIILLSISILIVIATILVVLKSNSGVTNKNESTNTGNATNGTEENPTVEINRDITYEVNKGGYMIYPKKVDKVFVNNEVGIITDSYFGEQLFEFVYQSLDEIYQSTKDLNDDQILQYYEENETIKINSYHIYSEEDFYSIAKDIKKIKENDTNASFSSAEIDESTIQEGTNGKQFDMILKFTNSQTIRLRTFVSNITNKIAFQKEFGLEDIFKKYTGDIDEASLRKFMYNFENSSMAAINNLAKEKSYNAILQQYDNKKEQINSYGIYDANDYLEIANQIISVRWSKGATVKSYTVDEGSLANNGKYTSFNVTLNYTTGDTVELKLGIANSKDQTPQFIVAKK